MKARDPLLGYTAGGGRDALTSLAPTRTSRWGRRLAWASYAHLALAVATIVGWEHLDVLWPTSIWPEGIGVGSQRPLVGILTVGDAGRPSKLTTSEGLLDDWRWWLQEDYRVDSGQCVAITEQLRGKLLSGVKPRPGSAGLVQYWVETSVSRRFGPPRCAESGGLHIATTVDSLKSARLVPCSRDVFVAHGFVCPGERRSSTRLSETYIDTSDYYPPIAVKKEIEGSTRVEVDRDETGSPTDCRVTKSSGSAELDVQTCKLVGTDPEFTYMSKARDVEGLIRTIRQTVTWKLPAEEPIDTERPPAM